MKKLLVIAALIATPASAQNLYGNQGQGMWGNQNPLGAQSIIRPPVVQQPQPQPTYVPYPQQPQPQSYGYDQQRRW
jgi:hypothetical protein